MCKAENEVILGPFFDSMIWPTFILLSSLDALDAKASALTFTIRLGHFAVLETPVTAAREVVIDVIMTSIISISAGDKI